MAPALLDPALALSRWDGRPISTCPAPIPPRHLSLLQRPAPRPRLSVLAAHLGGRWARRGKGGRTPGGGSDCTLPPAAAGTSDARGRPALLSPQPHTEHLNIPESFREPKTWPLSTTEEPSPEQQRVRPSPTRSRKGREPQTPASSPPAPARQPADGIAPPKLPTVPLDTRANMLCGVCSGTALSWALGTLPGQGAGLLTPPVNAGPYVLAEPAIPSLSWTQHRSQARPGGAPLPILNQPESRRSWLTGLPAPILAPLPGPQRPPRATLILKPSPPTPVRPIPPATEGILPAHLAHVPAQGTAWARVVSCLGRCPARS
ncbi:hypothetical protein E2I00_001777 [Balaenoptera physalus]|uniref:Uncharacterized protein n=1 Tax=Balaenoptera physalus TaxID=9770 RepID=A0A643C1E4_BALPH|nr:hypothetical protein E2I00_001777 [Balaenoptera physalus]